MDGATFNNIEIINELSTLGSFYFMLYFTDWCQDVELKNSVGKLFMYYMICVIALNFWLVLKEMLMGLKVWNRIR